MRSSQQARSSEHAQEIAHTLTTTILTMPVLAGAGDRLYGSVTSADVADEIWRTRKIRVDRRKVKLEEPDQGLGTYQSIEVYRLGRRRRRPGRGSNLDLPVGGDDKTRNRTVAAMISEAEPAAGRSPANRAMAERRQRGVTSGGDRRLRRRTSTPSGRCWAR